MKRVSRAWPLSSMSEIAKLMFLVPAGLWLWAAPSAQLEPILPPGSGWRPPSLTPLHTWFVLGIVGTALVAGSLFLAERNEGGHRNQADHDRLLIVLVALVGLAAEFLLVHFVTAHELGIAPYFERNEGAGAITVLVAAQPILVGGLALLWSRLLPAQSAEMDHGARRALDWGSLVGILGMALTTGAFLVWADHNGLGNLLSVQPSFIGWIKGSRDFGSWWPGVFATMVSLTAVAFLSAPGVTWKARKISQPVVPSTSDSLTVGA